MRACKIYLGASKSAKSPKETPKEKKEKKGRNKESLK